jgi:hypothetical protein
LEREEQGEEKMQGSSWCSENYAESLENTKI